MLDVAIRYQDQLIDKFRTVWLKERYKFWAGTSYFEDWQPINSTSRHSSTGRADAL